MRISTDYFFHRGVTAMLDQQAALSKTQLQLATGKRVLSPSDDPSATAQSLNLADMLALTSQYQRNADNATMRLSQEESVLEGVGDILQRVRELAVQGMNDTLSSGDRLALANEVRLQLDGVLELANNKDGQGDNLFGGYLVEGAAFSHDGAGNFTYNGDDGQRRLQVGASRSVASGDPGSDIFLGVDDGAGGMTSTFDILYGLATDLEANNPQSVSLTQLDNAMDRANQVRTKIGARMNAVDSQKAVNDSFTLMMDKNRSELEDLDYAEASSRFSRQMLALQASQQSFVKVEGMSMFNYLR